MRARKYTYIPNAEIESITTWNGKEIQGSKLLDGAYARGKVQYGDGGMAEGGEIRRFDRHQQMDSETRGEILDTIKEFNLIEGFNNLQNYLYGLFDGYDYSQTDSFKNSMRKLKKTREKGLYDRIQRIYDKIDQYSFEQMARGGMMAKGGKTDMFYEGQSVLYPMTNNTKLDKSVRDKHNKYANKELVIEEIMDEGGKYKIAKVFVRSSGEKVPFDLILNPNYLEQMARGGMMAKGGYASRHRKRTLEEKAEELVGSGTWHSLDRQTKADVISEMVTEEIIPIVAEKGTIVSDKLSVTFTLANGKVVKQNYDSKEKMDDGIADMYLENDVIEIKIDEPIAKEEKKSIFDIAKKSETKTKSTKEKKGVEVDGIESEISRYDELKAIINNAKAEQEVIGGRLKEIGKDKFIELYEIMKSKPENFNLVDGDEKIMFIVMDKYKKVEPEKEAILEQYPGLLEKVTTYSFNPEVLDRVGETINNLIMNSKDISEEDKKKLLVVDTTIGVKKGSIDRLMQYDNPEEIFNLIEPILALK